MVLMSSNIEFNGTFDDKAGNIRGSPFQFSVAATADESNSAINGHILNKDIEVWEKQCPLTIRFP